MEWEAPNFIPNASASHCRRFNVIQKSNMALWMYNYLGVHQYGLDIDNVIEFMQYQERVKNNVAVVKHTPPPIFG